MTMDKLKPEVREALGELSLYASFWEGSGDVDIWREAIEAELRRLTEQVETLQAERDALREDAERYRWLRDGCNAKHSEATHIAKNCWGMEWDLAIDKARIVHEQEGSS